MKKHKKEPSECRPDITHQVKIQLYLLRDRSLFMCHVWWVHFSQARKGYMTPPPRLLIKIKLHDPPPHQQCKKTTDPPPFIRKYHTGGGGTAVYQGYVGVRRKSPCSDKNLP